MASTVINKFEGLNTSTGVFNSQNSLSAAWNVDIPTDGVIRSRRGIARTAVTGLKSTHSIVSLPMLGGQLLVNHDQGSDYAQCDALGGIITGSGTLTAVAASGFTNIKNGSYWEQQMRGAQVAQNAYLTSRQGLRRLQAIASSSLFGAGMPRGLPLGQGQVYGATFSVLTAGTLLAVNSAVAYRVTWHMRDAYGKEIGGAPTGRAVVINKTGTTGFATATSDVVCRIYLPRAIGTASTALTTSYFFRIWRSRTSTATPDDEMYQVYEATLTAGNISAGYVDVTDATPDAVLVGGPKLHTNANDFLPDYAPLVRGITNADEPPPYGNDVAEWADCLWVANLREWGSQNITMLTVPADADTITINGTVYTFKTTPGAATHVQRVTGYASNSDNIEASCRALCDRINLDVATTKCYAFYLSGPSQLPGQIALVAAEVGPLSTFTTTTAVSASAKWLLGGWAGEDASTFARGTLAFSKPGRADSMPVAHRMRVGSSGNAILRIVPYRNQLFVFTEQGIYRVTGDSPATFSIDLYDGSYRLFGTGLVATIEDAVYAWCHEGVIRIDQGGSQVVSEKIRATTQYLQSKNPYHAALSFAVGNSTDHQVLFFYPDPLLNSSEVYESGCCYALCFNTLTGAWTQWRNDATYTGADLATHQQGYFCGASCRGSDGVETMWFGESRVTDATCSIFKVRGVTDASPFAETDRAGLTNFVLPDVTWNFIVPSGHDAVHWQELLIHWDSNAALGLVVPPFYPDLTWYAEDGTVTTSVPEENIYDIAYTRCAVPRAARRRNRLAVRITKRVDDAAGAWGINGISLRFEPGSKMVQK